MTTLEFESRFADLVALMTSTQGELGADLMAEPSDCAGVLAVVPEDVAVLALLDA